MSDAEAIEAVATLAAEVADWRRSEVRAQLARRHAGPWDVPLLAAELLDFDVCELYAALCVRHGQDAVAGFMRAVLRADPSAGKAAGVALEQLLDEPPVSRLVVAFVWLMATRCAGDVGRALESELWANLKAARHAFWPELLWEILGKLCSARELLPRALDLICADDPAGQVAGADLVYALPLARDEILAELDRRIAAARGDARARLQSARRSRAGSWLAGWMPRRAR